MPTQNLVRAGKWSSTDVGRVVRPNDRAQLLIVVMPPSVNLDLDFLNFVWSVRNHLPRNTPTDPLAALFLVCMLDMHTSQTIIYY